MKRATLDSGIIVSALVETAVPVDEPPLAGGADRVGREISYRVAAIALSEFFCEEEATVPATALVVCEPLAGPPVVLI